MAILARYLVQCEVCGLFLAPGHFPQAVVQSEILADMGNTPHDAVAKAVARGWRAYPVLCPQCSPNEVTHDEQDGRPVPQPGQDAERTEGGGGRTPG